MVLFTCAFVFVTVILSVLATVFLSVSLLSNEWEYLSYRVESVREISVAHNHTVQWIGGVARLQTQDGPAYLIPAFGGVNRLCIDISDAARQRMQEEDFSVEDCISYLSNGRVLSKDAWLDRMRNLAMSCAMVCLILLASSAPLGILGLFKKQISTIMVTGVMYILAAVFGVFNLAFMHFKRVKSDGLFTSTVLDTHFPEEYMTSRFFKVGWPPSAEWAGLCLCVVGSLFWLILAKIYRFQMLTPT